MCIISSSSNMDKYNQNSCTSTESFKYNIYSDIAKCETIIEESTCEYKQNNFKNILSYLKKISYILDNYENTEKKELKKHTMNLRPRKNKIVGSVDVIGEAPPYPFYNFSL